MTSVRAVLGLLLVSACGDDGSPPLSDDDDATMSSSVGGTTPTTASSTSTSSSGATSTGSTSTTTSTSNSGGTSTTAATTDPACDGPNTTGNAGTGSMGYDFRELPYCEYVQIDRIGFPLVTTLFIDDDDAYNASPPVDADVVQYGPDVNAAINAAHVALDTDLSGGGFTPCNFGQCNAALTPLLFQDKLRLVPDDPDQFPNGRRPTEPTLDLVLALLLLDLGIHTIDAFVPMGPPQNDVTLPTQWPFVAAPQ